MLGGESYPALAQAWRTRCAARRRATRASQRQPLGRLPQPGQGGCAGSDPPLPGARPPLRDDGDPQQSRRRARERRHREPARPRQGRIAQALLLRGSSAFDRLDDYRAFVAEVIAQHNRRHAAAIDAERAALRPLPPAPAMTWEEMTVRVTTAVRLHVPPRLLLMPSRLIGHRLRLRIHDDRIEAYLGGSFLLALPRGRRAKRARASRSRRRLSARHLGPARQARCADPSRLSRRALATCRLPPGLGGARPGPSGTRGLPGPWSACWRSRMTVAWRPTSPWRSTRCSTPASCRSWP